MKLPTDPRAQAVLASSLIWGIDAPMILTPAVLTGTLNGAAIVQAAVIVGGGWIFCLGLYEVLARRPASRLKATLVMLGSVVTAALAVGAIDALVVHLMAPAMPSTDLLIRAVSNTIFVGWMFVFFSAIVLLLAAGRTVAEREAALARAESRAARAQAAATAARLAALRYQLNPHFLFNTLNAVSSAVIAHRHEEAESMLTRLASFLRSTLAGDPAEEVRLEDELGTVEAYLEIEAERFRDRLRTRIDCPTALRSALVPNFILQPLIENVMKHGVSRSREPVTLELGITCDGGDLVIAVEDDARPVATSAGADSGGVGLGAVGERLEVLYGGRGSLTAAPRDRGYRAEIRLPLKLRTIEGSPA